MLPESSPERDPSASLADAAARDWFPGVTPIDVGIDVPHIQFYVARCRELRRQAYRLIHDNYVREGYLRPSALGMRIVPYDLEPDTVTYVACCRDTVVATVTLVRDAVLGLPLEAIYVDEVADLRRRGRVLAEAIGLAARRRGLTRNLLVFLGLTRLLAQDAQRRGVDDLLVAAHPLQQKFYERTLQFERVGPLRHYPSVQNNPALGFRLDLKDVLQQQVTNPRAYARYFGGRATTPLVHEPVPAEDERYFAQLLETIQAETGRFEHAAAG